MKIKKRERFIDSKSNGVPCLYFLFLYQTLPNGLVFIQDAALL